jgi:DNA-directed RNA polymerase specialized sigma24 family protein
METKELVTKLLAKDITGFNYLYDHYCVPLYKIINTATKDNALAGKILHDVFIKIYLSIGDFDISKHSLLIWMIRITINHTTVTLQLSKRKCLDIYSLKNIGLSHTLLIEKDRQLAG